MKNSLRRLVADYKRKKTSFQDLWETFEEEIIIYRLPLYLSLKKHKKIMKRKRSKILAINKITFKKGSTRYFLRYETGNKMVLLILFWLQYLYPVNLLCGSSGKLRQFLTGFISFILVILGYEAEKGIKIIILKLY
jgi:hypothetical protein